MSAPRKPDLLARLLGLLTFLGGLAVIVFVLKLGYRLFLDPTLGQSLKPAGPDESALMALGRSFMALIVRILLLFLGSVCGSLIANKGMRLYVGALQAQATQSPREEAT
jgi:hypothetical protein